MYDHTIEDLSMEGLHFEGLLEVIEMIGLFVEYQTGEIGLIGPQSDVDVLNVECLAT